MMTYCFLSYFSLSVLTGYNRRLWLSDPWLICSSVSHCSCILYIVDCLLTPLCCHSVACLVLSQLWLFWSWLIVDSSVYCYCPSCRFSFVCNPLHVFIWLTYCHASRIRRINMLSVPVILMYCPPLLCLIYAVAQTSSHRTTPYYVIDLLLCWVYSLFYLPKFLIVPYYLHQVRCLRISVSCSILSDKCDPSLLSILHISLSEFPVEVPSSVSWFLCSIDPMQSRQRYQSSDG